MRQGGRKRVVKTPGEQSEGVFQEQAKDGIQGVVGELEAESREPTFHLTGLFRAHMANMGVREAQRVQECAQQERRLKALQHLFSLLQLEVQAHTTPTPDPLLTAGDLLTNSRG